MRTQVILLVVQGHLSEEEQLLTIGYTIQGLSYSLIPPLYLITLK